MTDELYDAPAYCNMCDAPIDGSDMLCGGCAFKLIDDMDEGLSWESAADLAHMTMVNGNLTDGVNLIMYDGDVRADSVKAALRLLVHWTDNGTTIHSATGIIIRAIEKWETQ